jgi:hypothetical protein
VKAGQYTTSVWRICELTSPLCLEDGGLCFDLRDLLFGLTFPSSLTDFTAHASFGDVDSCLVGRSFVCFARKEGEVLGAGGILQLLNVGVVDAQTELVEFILDVFDDLPTC